MTWIPMATVTRRLILALAVSIAAHTAFVMLPYAGGTGQGAELGAEDSRPARGLQFRIVSIQAAQSAALPADQAVGVPEFAAPDSHRERPVNTERAQIREHGPLPISAPAFYTTDQLSKRPALLGDDPLEATPLRMLASSGKLMLKLWINDRGQVVEAEAEKSELPAEFVAAAAAAFKQGRFSPGERGGLPVGSVIRIEVRYSDSRRSS